MIVSLILLALWVNFIFLRDKLWTEGQEVNIHTVLKHIPRSASSSLQTPSIPQSHKMRGYRILEYQNYSLSECDALYSDRSVPTSGSACYLRIQCITKCLPSRWRQSGTSCTMVPVWQTAGTLSQANVNLILS